MKKLAIALLLSAAIMMTGCQGDKTGDTPAASKTEEVNQASDELKEKLFVEVKQQLEDYMTTSTYQQLLIKQIKNIQKEAGSGKLILYIDPADSDKRSSLQAATGAPITVSEYSFMGGTRAVLQDRNILIDNSFASKLEKLKADFSFNGGATNA